MTIANESGGKILPCPFCGSADEVRLKDDAIGHKHEWMVICDALNGCAGGMVRWFRTEAEAVAAWNTRTPAIPQEDGAREGDGMTSETIAALAERFRSYGNYASDDRTPYVYAVDMHEAITAGAIPGVTTHSLATLEAYIASENGLRASLEKMRAERDAALGRYADAVREVEAAGNAGVAVGMEQGRREIAALLEQRNKARNELAAAQTSHAEMRRELEKSEAECAGLRALLSVARDSVEFEVQEKRQNWGDRLMHKQQGAIDLLAKITAAITPTPAAERGGAV